MFERSESPWGGMRPYFAENRIADILLLISILFLAGSAHEKRVVPISDPTFTSHSIVASHLSVVASALILASVVLKGIHRWRANHCHRHAERRFCTNCGYDLRVTPDRCPECGTVPLKANFSN